MTLRILPLGKTHAVNAFRCGNQVLDRWLQTTAMQHQRHGASRTFVLISDAAPEVILGFYTLAIRSLVLTSDLPEPLQKRLPHRVAGFTLARLATSSQEQRNGYGGQLLISAMERVVLASRSVGGYALFVDAKDGLAAFYEHFGFQSLPSNPDVLVLSIASMPSFTYASSRNHG